MELFFSTFAEKVSVSVLLLQVIVLVISSSRGLRSRVNYGKLERDRDMMDVVCGRDVEKPVLQKIPNLSIEAQVAL